MPPKTYGSAPGNRRGFCATCGTPMFYASEGQPGETHFYAALLEDPAAVLPTEHFHADEQLSWLHLGDDLPRS